ncbi:sperm-egg fusion protein TMEM95 isoform X1 [Sminthopsis crassicaudata]|uniref:sperm-egg fusion protein TMEM95 isoform X1 n=1 Tax=Sminthopsis crassicaudata TaxID=9301 RepID=UPI003D684289
MWVLMLGYLFLSTSQACIFCRLPSRDLSARLAHLCEQISSEWEDCKTSWNFSTFALDEVSMDRITEKTHRVMTVLEIKGYLFSLPTYWQWLQKSKLPEYMRQGIRHEGWKDYPVQLLHMQSCRGSLLGSQALYPRKTGPKGSQDSAPVFFSCFINSRFHQLYNRIQISPCRATLLKRFQDFPPSFHLQSLPVDSVLAIHSKLSALPTSKDHSHT